MTDADRVYWRLSDMKAAICDSEASRHVPVEWKNEFPQIPWRRIADLGNHVRHAYHALDLGILWSIYEHDLDAIEAVIDILVERARRAKPT